jgi:hypothetical protein
MDWILPARLLVAHILGDFVLQPDHWVADRSKRHFASPYLYAHGLIHFILAAGLSFEPNGWWIGATIGVGHIVLDGFKALLKGNSVIAFIIDQALHIAIIAFCACYISGTNLVLTFQAVVYNPYLWWIACGYGLNAFLYPKLIALATEKWRVHVPPDRELLYKAGRWIGVIERMLVFTFVLIHQWAAVGFLMAAKSVFRFGDLREGKDKGHTEYVLIGTLLSFALALATALIIQIILQQIAR